MINLKDELEIYIEKMAYGGDGIAKYGDEKFVIFVKDAVVNDTVKVKITSLHKNYAKGEIIDIIKPSEYRTKPFCPIYNACGSCQNQNYKYDFLVEQKTLILKDIFKDIIDEKYIYPVIKSPDIKEYRHKIQYPCRQTKNSKRILMGYFRENSHDLTNIKFCPIQPKIIDKLAQYIKDNYKPDCYDEKKAKGLLKNILIRISADNNSMLLTFVLNCEENNFKYYKNTFDIFSKNMISTFKELKGIFVNFNKTKTNKILGNKTIKIVGDDYIIEKLKNKTYKIGPTSFFQINPKSAENLFDTVKENIKENSTILDAYGGVGTIGIYIGENAKKITLVEEDKNVLLTAEDNFKLNNIKNHEIYIGDAKAHFNDFLNQKKTFDYAILDPPRAGCEKEALDIISTLSDNIIYVSCNPQTLKRDIKLLLQKDFKLKSIKGVDLFPYTYHIESVAVLKKEN